MTVRSFNIHIPESQLADLRERLGNTRLPASFEDESWDDGTSLKFFARLLHYWKNSFDWRAQEARLNRLPQFVAQIDGHDIHFVHQRGKGSAPMPLVLTHGWPGSFAEMERLIPMLADPASHGGDPADAFNVIVPSLPGYGFSPAPLSSGVNSRHIAGTWLKLMHTLGYSKFGAQGGDIGAGVSFWLAREHATSVAGVHVNYIPSSYKPAVGEEGVSAEEAAFLTTAASWAGTEGAYAAMQGTKPLSLAYGLSDSPAGLAAWMLEKFRTWSDCDGDVERAVTLDDLLTDVSLYWFSDSVYASLRLYKENRLCPLVFAPGERIVPPLGVAIFPRELPMPPRSWVERAFDVRQWTEMPRGGHFAAMEQPNLLVEDIRKFFRPLREHL